MLKVAASSSTFLRGIKHARNFSAYPIKKVAVIGLGLMGHGVVIEQFVCGM